MKKFAFFDVAGNPIYVAQPSNDNEYESGRLYGDALCMEIDASLDDKHVILTRYVKDGALKSRPLKPSEHYEWSADSESWVPMIESARAEKYRQISFELEARIYAPCNGFDADKVSRDRISGMIARLQRGDGLPAGWVGWRDAENTMHWTTDDAATVLANLTALSRAIEDREQALLVANWTHKANIAALEDIDAILAYDTTAAW